MINQDHWHFSGEAKEQSLSLEKKEKKGKYCVIIICNTYIIINRINIKKIYFYLFNLFTSIKICVN